MYREAKLDDIALRRFLFYFIGSFLFGNNRSMLTCKLLGVMRVVSNIGAYYWGGPFLWILYRNLEVGFVMCLLEPRGLLASSNMVGIQVYPNPMPTVFRPFIRNLS